MTPPFLPKSMMRSTGIYSIALFAGKLTGFLLLPVYTRYLTPADYGAAELLELTLYVFVVLVGMKFGDALMYYYASAHTTKEKHTLTSTVYLSSLFLSIAGSFVGYLLSPFLSTLVFKDAHYIQYFHFMFAAFAMQLPQEVALASMRARDQAKAYVKTSIAQMLLAGTGNVIALVGFNGGLRGLLVSKIAVYSVMIIGLTVYLFSSIRVCFDRRMSVKALRYAGPMGVGGIGFLIIHYGDRFFLQRYVSLSEIGIYALAYKLGMLVSVAFTPFELYWGAQRFQMVRGRDGELLFVRIATYVAVFLTFVVVLLALFSGPLIDLMSGSGYREAAKYVPWIATAYLIRTLGQYFRNVFLIEGKTEWDAAVVWSGALSCLLGYATLIPRFGLWGAVSATGIAFTMMLFVSFWQAQRMRLYHYEYRRMGLVGLAGLLVIGIFALLHIELPLARVGIAVILSGLYPFVLWITGFLDPEEQRHLRVMIHKFQGRLI